jgi:hypothetical protein
MMKITKEQFNDILVAFQINDQRYIHLGVQMVANNRLSEDYFSEVPEYMKSSLCRKVLRYVAQTALRGTMEIDGLASSCSFCEMKNGHPVSFGGLNYWSFWSQRLNKKINVEILISEEECFQPRTAKFYDYEHNLLMEVEIWQGCHWTQSIGRIDLMGYFDDVRNPLMI